MTPLPVAGLVTKRVLVMDFLKGVPLSRSVAKMQELGIDPDSPEAQLFGRKLLAALTEAFGLTILEGGFFHAGLLPKGGIRPAPSCIDGTWALQDDIGRFSGTITLLEERCAR